MHYLSENEYDKVDIYTLCVHTALDKSRLATYVPTYNKILIPTIHIVTIKNML
jgi:hypothetical protein